MSLDGDTLTSLLFFVVGALTFFIVPLATTVVVLNLLIERRLRAKGIKKSKFYWHKLIAVSIILLVAGLFLYDSYYKSY